MQSLHCLRVKRIEVLVVVFFSSAHLAYSAELLFEGGAKSADAPKVTMAEPVHPGKVFGARIRCAANPVVTKAPVEGKPPAPIIVIRGPNGLTISSDDLDALDEFEHLLSAAADGSGNGPMAVFYLKYAKAQTVATELDTLLAGVLGRLGGFFREGIRKPQGLGYRLDQDYA